jgi:hypothetical protein
MYAIFDWQGSITGKCRYIVPTYILGHLSFTFETKKQFKVKLEEAKIQYVSCIIVLLPDKVWVETAIFCSKEMLQQMFVTTSQLFKIKLFQIRINILMSTNNVRINNIRTNRVRTNKVRTNNVRTNNVRTSSFRTIPDVPRRVCIAS